MWVEQYVLYAQEWENIGGPFKKGLWKEAFSTLLDLGRYQASHFVILRFWPTLQALASATGLYNLGF